MSDKGLNEQIKVSAEEGLSTKQVKMLTNLGQINLVNDESYKSIWQIIRGNVFTFFNFVFFILSVFLISIQSYKDMLFIFIVLANTLIGIFQQIRSKMKLDKLKLISSLKTVVIRNKKKQRILNSEIVKNEIFFLKTGDQIAVDGVVLNGEIQVDESLLTGESDPVLKLQSSNLLSGSFVLSGSCVAQATRVGKNCYANRLTIEAKKSKKTGESKMIKALNKLVKLIGIVLLPIGFIMFFKEFFILHNSYSRTVQVVCAALIGMIPEGLYLLTSVALAISVLKLIESKTLVHEMGCIETLARVDVLCVDKTGTITKPKMEVSSVFHFNLKSNTGLTITKVTQILNEMVFYMSADSETVIALKNYFKDPHDETKFLLKKLHPFLSATKWSAIEFETQGTFILGAAEFIMKNNYNEIKNQVNRCSKEGKRVLLFAKLDGVINDGQIVGTTIPLCLILIENPIRVTAAETFKFFEKQGVEIKIISGDNPVAVSSVCRKLNLKNADRFIDASTIKNEVELERALNEVTIFGRVTPNQKQQFVKILQKKWGHTVAMTGDGVNDVLALRQADVGVAMASGSSAASQAAEIVLLDSNFAAMPKIVHEGRRVINNIERSAALFLVKNIFSFFFVLLSLFFKISFPITPFQLTCISFFTIGLPSFLLTLENSASLIKGSFLTNVFKKAAPGGICNIFIIFLAQLIAKIFNFSFDKTSWICVLMLAFNGLAVLFELCRPFNLKRSLVVATTTGLMVGSLLILIILPQYSYFNFLYDFITLILVLVLFLIDYFILKVLINFFNFKLFKMDFQNFINKVAKTLKFLK